MKWQDIQALHLGRLSMIAFDSFHGLEMDVLVNNLTSLYCRGNKLYELH